MRTIRVLMMCSVLAAMLAPATPAQAGPSDDVVPVHVEWADEETALDGHEVDCSGFAPEEPTCVGTFTVPDVDRFGIDIAAGPGGYTGTIEVQAQASTGFTTIVCDVAIQGHCYYQQVGFFFVGQTVTLVGVASGLGNWIIKAPTPVTG